ncbi:uncharacterized protein LOC119568789 [Penaeus monodon]|uniref:uncharacterized protein LOC119568789 n=1 Tax=Penaeus monodon TaxID=6687 RepID=UPI0018A6D6EC|nr:uncharacterized protein LOC119568789 [Penaeus monodon]
MSSISKRNFFPLPPGFSKAGYPDGGMFRKRLEKVILLLCLSVTTAVLVYWRVHNQELSTIIIEQAIEDPYLSLPSNVKENGAWVDRLPRGVVVWSQPLAGSLGVGKLLTSGLKNSLVSFEPFAPEQPDPPRARGQHHLHHHRLSLLNDLLHCRYFRHKDLVDHLSSRSSFPVTTILFLRSRCASVPEKCLSNGTFISHICHEASVHFLKVRGGSGTGIVKIACIQASCWSSARYNGSKYSNPTFRTPT